MFLQRMVRQLMARVKETTGIVGLDVVPNAREVLIGLYSKTLKEIQAAPDDEVYQKAIESFTRHRLQVCKEEEDWEAIERRLGCGQVDELIEEAEDELKLIAKMIGFLCDGASRPRLLKSPIPPDSYIGSLIAKSNTTSGVIVFGHFGQCGGNTFHNCFVAFLYQCTN